MEVRIQFKDATQGIFNDISRNELVLRIQPSEAVYMKMNAKLPGFATRAVPVELDLTYKKRFTEAKIPQAYEALILDAFKGDHSNFVRDDELDVAWKIFTPLLHWIDGKDGGKFRWNGCQTVADEQLRSLNRLVTPTGLVVPRTLMNSPLDTATHAPQGMNSEHEDLLG